jgi:hypothetical protein
MNLSTHQQATLYVILGLYLIVTGLFSKTLISESDIPATAEERARAKATPLGRVISASIGSAGVIYGLYLFFH